jgi:hypothetical protein
MVINIREIACTLSPWVLHWIICLSFLEINPQACASFKVLANGTQFNNLLYFSPNQHNDKKQMYNPTTTNKKLICVMSPHFEG